MASPKSSLPRALGSGAGLFYGLTALIFAADNALLTGVIWLSLRLTDSPILLGGVLCLSIVISWLLGRISGPAFRSMSLGKLAFIRIAAFTFVAVLALADVAGKPIGFLLVGLAIGVADYFTFNGLETENAMRVVNGEISSHDSSRVMQAAIQCGSFLGGLAGGFLLGPMGSLAFLTTLAVVSGLLSLALIPLHGRRPRAGRTTRETVVEDAPTMVGRAGTPGRADPAFLPLLLCLGAVGAQIGAYNVVIPIVFQKINHWTAASFGLTEGLVGVGSLLSAILPPIPAHRLTFPLLIVTANAVISFSGVEPAAQAGAFLAGFAVNQVRIAVRSRLADIARTEADAQLIGARAAFYFLMFQASAPLVMATLTAPTLLGFAYTPAIFVLCGLFVVAVAAFIPERRPLQAVAAS